MAKVSKKAVVSKQAKTYKSSAAGKKSSVVGKKSSVAGKTLARKNSKVATASQARGASQKRSPKTAK